MLHARRDIVPLLVPDHHDAAAAKARETAEDCLIVAEIAVTGERHPVVEQPRDIMFEMRPVGMACNLRFLPRRQPGIDIAQHFRGFRSEEHTSELQSLMRISYAVFCLK